MPSNVLQMTYSVNNNPSQQHFAIISTLAKHVKMHHLDFFSIVETVEQSSQ